MNRNQIIIYCATISIMIAMAIIPPFKIAVQDGYYNLGYHFIFSPPMDMSLINFERITIQELVIMIVGLSACYLMADKKQSKLEEVTNAEE